MKKFLSSLLALTMILSLVIVPARAAADDISLSKTTVSVVKDEVSDSVTATAPTLTDCEELSGKEGYTRNSTSWLWTTSSKAFTISGEATSTVNISGKSKTSSAQTLVCTYTAT